MLLELTKYEFLSPLENFPVDFGLKFAKFISPSTHHQLEILSFPILKPIKLQSETIFKIIPFQLPPFQ